MARSGLFQAFTIIVNMMYKKDKPIRRGCTAKRFYVAAIFSLACVGSRNFFHTAETIKRKDLDVHVVLSHFAEPMSDVIPTIYEIGKTFKTPRFTVYTKGQQELISFENFEVRYVQNEGREGDAYLRFIIEHYYSLPDYTLFTQAVPNDFKNSFKNGLKRFSRDASLVNLGTNENCTCDGCFQTKGSMIRLREIYAAATGVMCMGEFRTFLNGQFIASRDAILSQPLAFYQQMLDMLHAPPGHWIHDDTAYITMPKEVEDGEENNNNPLFGHVLERLWAPILGCTEPSADGVCYKSRLPVHKRDVPGKTIWLLWLEGWDKAPYIVKECAKSWRYQNPDWNIEYLSYSNIDDFLSIRHLHTSTVTPQAKSDIIRLALLTEYGGVWADATLACMQPLDNWVYGALAPSGFWAYQGTGWPPPKIINHTNAIYPASWFMVSTRNNYIVRMWNEAADSYWTRKASTSDYFWMDRLFRDILASNRMVQSLWGQTPYLSCEDPYSSHMFAGKTHWKMNVRDKVVLMSNPPFVLKLSHKQVPKRESYLYYRTNAYQAVKIANTLTSYNPFQWDNPPWASSSVYKADCLGVSNSTDKKVLILDSCDFCSQIVDHFECRPIARGIT